MFDLAVKRFGSAPRLEFVRPVIKVMDFAFLRNSGFPVVLFGSVSDPGVVAFVKAVKALIALPQIVPFVIRGVCIDMINDFRRLLAGHQKPGNAVSRIRYFFKANLHISALVDTSRRLAGPVFSIAFAPAKKTSIRVVNQGISNAFGYQFHKQIIQGGYDHAYT